MSALKHVRRRETLLLKQRGCQLQYFASVIGTVRNSGVSQCDSDVSASDLLQMSPVTPPNETVTNDFRASPG